MSTQIALREFQRNASEYINQLPVELTRYGKVVAYVVGPGQFKKPLTTQFKPPSEKKFEKIIKKASQKEVIAKITNETCEHAAAKKMCKVSSCKNYYGQH